MAGTTNDPTPAREVPACDRGVKILTPPPISFAAPTNVGKSGSGAPAPAASDKKPTVGATADPTAPTGRVLRFDCIRHVDANGNRIDPPKHK